MARMTYCPQCGATLRARIIDDVTRLICNNTSCGYVHWNNPVPVVAALVRHDGDYLIARNAQWPANIFSVITGYLEQNETPEQAVLREVTEELGLNGRVRRHIGNYVFFEKNQLILCYEVDADGRVKLNHELAEFKRLSAEALKTYNFEPLYITQAIVRDWMAMESNRA